MSVVAVFGITVASAATAVGAYLYLRGDGETTVAETPNDDPRNDGEDDKEYSITTDEDGTKNLSITTEDVSVSHEIDKPDNGIITEDNEVDDNPSEKTDLENVKGIGETRAESFREEGFGTPDDLYYATDENLCEVNGIGDLTVSQIRDDIGSVDEDGYE
jgi:DNA uptake protein ComE-like DNA-binding protein